MMERLSLDKLFFGKTDAFNEVKEYGPEWFKKAFFPYDKYKINDFINGHRYYICGEKGTGKSALLRYLQYTLLENRTNLVIPIRFKSDFDSSDKKEFLQTQTSTNENPTQGLEDISSELNTIKVWQVFILNKLLEESSFRKVALFKDDKNWKKLKSLIKIVYPEYKDRIVPKIKRGKLTLKSEVIKELSAEIELDVDFDNKSKTISYNKLAKLIWETFSKLKFNANAAYVLFDELELSVKSSKENERDTKLVRDLIIAVDRFNELCKTKGYNIHIIASIRTEVIRSTVAVGAEINKSIEDYGVIISWYQKGGDYLGNKLLKMIENKIIACEEQNGIMEHGNIWSKYFHTTINNVETRKYILNYSWMHPRDIIRLMNCVLEQHESEEKFTQEMFDRSMQNYSARSWLEISESMCLKYTTDDLTTIRKLFTNIEVPFTFQMVSKKLNSLIEIDMKYDLFKQKYQLSDILNDLFSYGVIGNSGQRMIFRFLGDDDYSITSNLIIHTPLRRFFGVKSREHSKTDIYND